jgi:hypothetical protein
MGLDVDAIAAHQAIEMLEKILSAQPHGEREEIADQIIEFVEAMAKKWNYKED